MKILVPSRPCTFAERLEIFKQVAEQVGAKPEKGVTQGFSPDGLAVRSAIEENALSINLGLADWCARGDFLLWNGARLFS